MTVLVRIYSGLLKIQVKYQINLKLDIFARPVCLHMGVLLFTSYFILPHNLIQDKLIDLIERTFGREDSPYFASNDNNAFFIAKQPKHTIHGLVKMYVMLWPFCWPTFYTIWH